MFAVDPEYSEVDIKVGNIKVNNLLQQVKVVHQCQSQVTGRPDAKSYTVPPIPDSSLDATYSTSMLNSRVGLASDGQWWTYLYLGGGASSCSAALLVDGGGMEAGGAVRGEQCLALLPVPVSVLLHNGAFADAGGMAEGSRGQGGGVRGSNLWSWPPGGESARSATADWCGSLASV